METFVYIFMDIFSLRHIPRQEIAGSYDNSTFTLLRNCQIAFPSGCTITHSSQQCMEFQFLHILSRLSITSLPFCTLPVCVNSYFSMVLTCVSLFTNDIMHILYGFIFCKLYIFFGGMLIPTSCPFKVWSFLNLLSGKVVYAFWILGPYQIDDQHALSVLCCHCLDYVFWRHSLC